MQQAELAYEDVRELYREASVMVVDKKPISEITAWLVAEGVEPDEAQRVVSELYRVCSEGSREQGQKNIVYGALWFGGGMAVTLASYSLAASSGGGVYLVTTGAIAVGGAQLLFGLYQCATA